jgi:hypothetical protein
MTSSSLKAGPRPQRGKRWAQIQREHRQNYFYRLVDHSFAFRLFLATASALVLLMGANRWDHCRELGFGTGCLQRDAGGIISVGNLEALSVATAAFLYLLEGRQRRLQQNVDAFKLILTFQQSGAKLSYARNDALEQLNEAGLWLDGLDLSQANLDELNASGGRWRRVNLHRASLRNAHFEDADLGGCDLRYADLSHGNFRHADLRGANLTGANLSHADLRGANLTGALTDGAQTDGTALQGAALTGTSLAVLGERSRNH